MEPSGFSAAEAVGAGFFEVGQDFQSSGGGREKKPRKYTTGARTDPLKLTPKKVRQALKVTREGLDPEYDLLRDQERALSGGIDELKKMSPRRAGKRSELCHRLRGGLLDGIIPEAIEFDARSPSKVGAMARAVAKSSWLGGKLHQLTDTYHQTPGSQDASWPKCKLVNLQHISNFDPSTGGLHLCDPTHPQWGFLQNRSTFLDNDVYIALVNDGVSPPKYSTLWPLGVTERQVIVMSESATSVVRKGNTELVSVTLPTGKMCHALRYHRVQQWLIPSFFPIVYCNAASMANLDFEHVLVFQADGVAPPVTIRVKSSDLIGHVQRSISTGLSIPDFEDRINGTIYFDCSNFLHPMGLPLVVQKGIIIQFTASEVGYKFEDMEFAAEARSSMTPDGGARLEVRMPRRRLIPLDERQYPTMPAFGDLGIVDDFDGGLAHNSEEEDDIEFGEEA